MASRRRKNPGLMLFHNPGDAPRGRHVARDRRRKRVNPEDTPQAPFAWEKFHLTDRDRARMTKVADIPGLPDQVVSLGLAEGIEMVDEHGVVEKVMLDPTRADGPWLVMDESGDNLWIVGRYPVTDLLAYDGYRSSAIMYFPPSNSGKHEAGRGYRHEWGEGGGFRKADWPKLAYPMLSMVDPLAYAMVDGNYHVSARGIVG